MRTHVCEMLGIEFPIVAFSHCRDVVAAVTNAGGLGVLGAVTHTEDELRQALDWIDDHVGGKPYGVDLLIPTKKVGAAEPGSGRRLRDMIPQGHLDYVDDLATRYELAPMDESQRRRVLGTQGDRIVDIAMQHPIRLIASALGAPPPALVEQAHERGILVAALAGKKQHAERHVAAGVDIVVAQGYEAAGHTGDIGGLALIPEIVDAVAPVPVLAAGGIVTGRQMAAAIALGAQGVWCGSVWLTTEEAETTEPLMRKFLAATSSDTVRTRTWSGKPARLLRTAWTDEWEQPGAPAPLAFPLQSILVDEVNERITLGQYRSDSGAAQLVTGAVGQGVGQMNTVRPVRRVVMDMVEDFIETVEHMSSILGVE